MDNETGNNKNNAVTHQGPPSNRMCHWTRQVYLQNGLHICRTV